jgi:hypothetical protein
MGNIRPGLILGYHGCDESVANKVVLGHDELKQSINKYDWLGHGIYFWDNSHSRAAEYANFLKEHSARSKHPIVTPAVLGAVISLGNCLDLLDYNNLKALRTSYEVLEAFHASSRFPMPQNRNVGNNTDLLLRELDCDVIEMLHQSRQQINLPPYDSVRGVFWEGPLLYPNAGFREKDHIQICVRNPNCIKGYFLPKKYNNSFRQVY